MRAADGDRVAGPEWKGAKCEFTVRWRLRLLVCFGETVFSQFPTLTSRKKSRKWFIHHPSLQISSFNVKWMRLWVYFWLINMCKAANITPSVGLMQFSWIRGTTSTLTEFKYCLFNDQSKHFASWEMWPNLNFIFQQDLKPTFRIASQCAAAETQQVSAPPGGRYVFRHCSLGCYFLYF